MEITTIQEFDENDRYFNTIWDPYLGHTLRIYLDISLEKRHKVIF
jgi:hypothetical protein